MEHAESTGYIVSSPQSPDDLKSLYSLNRTVHGVAVENLTRKMVDRRADVRKESFLIVKDRDANRVVATLAMIPWRIRYCGMELKALEMGIVATDGNHRMKGLQRLMNERFAGRMADEEFDMSLIQGIPGFYGNFGYHYAIPLENQVFIELHSIIQDDGAARCPCSIRKARDDDYEFIAGRYAAHSSGYGISSIITADHYRFMADLSYDAETDAEFFVVCEEGAPAGYFKVALHGFTDGLMLSEVSDMRYEHYSAVLGYLKALALDRGKPFIKCVLPGFHEFTRVACAMGGYHRWSYQWQLKLNLKRFFASIRPLLERRVGSSMFKGLTGRLALSLFSTGIALEFRDGSITGIEDYREQQEVCCMPLRSFCQLAMGCRSLGAIMEGDNQVFMTPRNLLLMETLFPACRSYLYNNY